MISREPLHTLAVDFDGAVPVEINVYSERRDYIEALAHATLL